MEYYSSELLLKHEPEKKFSYNIYLISAGAYNSESVITTHCFQYDNMPDAAKRTIELHEMFDLIPATYANGRSAYDLTDMTYQELIELVSCS